MIPTYEVVAEISLPQGDDCGYPARGELSDEGFGYFIGTWAIGHASVSSVREVVRFERELVDALDGLAGDRQEFEFLANAVEGFEPDGELEPTLGGTPVEQLLQECGEVTPLCGLEIGVAGLTYALSSVGFLTAASCRAHESHSSWTDCPVVFFGAHKWRAVILAGFALQANCGIGQDRGMLTLYAPSIRNLMSLAQALLANRTRFRSRPKAMQPLWA